MQRISFSDIFTCVLEQANPQLEPNIDEREEIYGNCLFKLINRYWIFFIQFLWDSNKVWDKSFREGTVIVVNVIRKCLFESYKNKVDFERFFFSNLKKNPQQPLNPSFHQFFLHNQLIARFPSFFTRIIKNRLKLCDIASDVQSFSISRE